MVPKIAIIILNWKQPQLTLETISSIKKVRSRLFSYHFILVDNGSPDSSLAIFKKTYAHDPAVTILPTGCNLGYAGGNNFGIRYALKKKYDYLLIANNDIVVDPHFLPELFRVLSQQPQLMITPKIYFAPGFEYHRDRYQPAELGHVFWAMGSLIDWKNIYGSNFAIDEVDHGQYDLHPPQPGFISGCCFLVTKDFFQKVGLFDEDYYLYLEDADLCQRAIRLGYQLQIVPQSIIWHKNSGSSGAGSPLHDYFLTRNRLLFAFKYASFRTKFAIFRESIRMLLTGRPWQKRGVADYYFRRLRQGSWS